MAYASGPQILLYLDSEESLLLGGCKYLNLTGASSWPLWDTDPFPTSSLQDCSHILLVDFG